MTTRPRPEMGLFDGPYWSFVDQGELRLQRCEECGSFRYPPGPACPDCGSEAATWTSLSGRGRLMAWTTFHRQYFPTMPPPYVVVVVRTEEGPLLIGNLADAEPRDLLLDMAMTATFEEVADPDGPWRICQWRPTQPTRRNEQR